MKTAKYHIIYSKILLICFIAGQYMVFAHQHNINNIHPKTYSYTKGLSQTTVSDKCYLCDVMHHNTMVINSNTYFSSVAVSLHVFKNTGYSFKSIQLILSGGRAPPSSDYKS
nr:hypothetical protein [Mucilaginibacter sp. X4EP1]